MDLVDRRQSEFSSDSAIDSTERRWWCLSKGNMEVKRAHVGESIQRAEETCPYSQYPVVPEYRYRLPQTPLRKTLGTFI